eukprot:4531263-Pyramimonas_sp.AAC.1
MALLSCRSWTRLQSNLVATLRWFWESITNTAFASKTNMYPLMRVALAIANLTGDRVEDGVARLL